MAFTAKDVQNLRERTGCGMMDCKKALTAANGDPEKAIEFLREKGLAAAAKKAGRIAAEGLVMTLVDNEKKAGVMIEVNAETDFVAKNEKFSSFVETCAKTVLENNPTDVEALLECKAAGSDFTVVELLREKILTIGENMKIRRFVRMDGELFSYVHGGGRIGVLVKFEADPTIAGTEKFQEYAKDIAMQIAASNPSFVSKDNVPFEDLEKEKEIFRVQALNEGKPENIVEKMVMGRINKYYKEVCLVEQPYIKDPDISVTKYTEQVSKELGGKIVIADFARFEKGEGLAKREDNFADEVASMMK